MAQKEKKYVVKNKSKSCLELKGKSGKRMPLLPDSEKVLTTAEYVEFQKSLAGFYKLVSIMQKGMEAPAEEKEPQRPQMETAPEVKEETVEEKSDDPEAEGDLEIPSTLEADQDTSESSVEEKPVQEDKEPKQSKKTRRKKSKKKAKKKA